MSDEKISTAEQRERVNNMEYDFEREGKQAVFNKLIEDIKGQADAASSKNSSASFRIKALQNLVKYSSDAEEILKDLTNRQNK